MKSFKPEDYYVVVRTYKRYEMFKSMTYQMLIDNKIDIANKLIIIVASEEEKLQYEKVIPGGTYFKMVVSSVGGHNAIKTSCGLFEVDTPLMFMDDDLEYFFEYIGTPSKETLDKRSFRLERYIIDAFKTMLETDIKIFSFSFYKNDFYIKDKAWKEFRPYNIAGSCFGALNSNLIMTDHAHLDDIHRTCNYIHEHGGALIYNWSGFETNTGKNPGGMQESGDRGTTDTRIQLMKDVCDQVYADPIVFRYCKPPQLVVYTGMWELKLKSITSIKKLKNFTARSWATYFQEKVDSSKEFSLDDI